MGCVFVVGLEKERKDLPTFAVEAFFAHFPPRLVGCEVGGCREHGEEERVADVRQRGRKE